MEAFLNVYHEKYLKCFPIEDFVKSWSMFHLYLNFKNKISQHFLLIYLTKDMRYVIYLFGVLRRFQHCTGHITTGSWKGRGNQYIQFARVVYCKLPTNGKQLPAFPLKAITGIEPWPQMWEARVLPLCHHGRYEI